MSHIIERNPFFRWQLFDKGTLDQLKKADQYKTVIKLKTENRMWL
jgi:hypothetical protein